MHLSCSLHLLKLGTCTRVKNKQEKIMSKSVDVIKKKKKRIQSVRFYLQWNQNPDYKYILVRNLVREIYKKRWVISVVYDQLVEK